jgi:hypothetical protein
VVAAVSLNAAVSIVLGLPVVPVTALGGTPVPAVNQVARDSVGWPTYVRQVAAAQRRLSPAERRRAVVVTSNYGEAGAVDRYGGPLGLRRAYSGHNALYDQARPPAGSTIAIMVGGQLVKARPHFRSCRTVGHLDNLVGVDNEEQGQPIALCRGPLGGWSRVWPALRHLD